MTPKKQATGIGRQCNMLCRFALVICCCQDSVNFGRDNDDTPDHNQKRTPNL
jgi:hypothetical protein